MSRPSARPWPDGRSASGRRRSVSSGSPDVKYLLTQKDFLALESNDARDILSVEQIETALTYIQKNGVQTYGISARMSVDALITLLESGENILTARVMETNLFSLIDQINED